MLGSSTLLITLFFFIFLAACAERNKNLITNGDFESGSTSPWICHGCTGSVSSPGHKGRYSLHIHDRTADWAGPRLELRTNNTIGPGSYTLKYSILVDQKTTFEWKVTLDKNGDSFYYEIHTEIVQPGDWKSSEAIVILPLAVANTEFFTIYLSTVDIDVDYRIDDIILEANIEGNWEEDANQRIDMLRKRNVNITVAVGSNINSNNIKLNIHQNTHSFPFGTALNTKMIVNCSDSGVDDEYCTVAKENFNWFVDSYQFKWRAQESEQGHLETEIANKTIKWVQVNNGKMRGDCILWDKKQNNPDWVQPLYGQELKNAVFTRVDTAVQMYDGKVQHWDVINEMVDQPIGTHQFYTDHSHDQDIRVKIINRAKDMSPNTLMFLNDYGIVEDRYGRFELFRAHVRNILQNGARIDALGIQSHIKDGNIVDVVGIKHRIDQLWNEFQLPMWITEFTWEPDRAIEDPNHSIHAEQLERFYRLLFSHEGIHGIVTWKLWHNDGLGLLNDDMTPNSAGEAYLRLYNQEWRSTQILNQQVINSGSGNLEFNFRGFMGDYRIKVLAGSTILNTVDITVDSDISQCIAVGDNSSCL